MVNLKQKLIENKNIFDEILLSCNNIFLKGCGSYLFDGKTYEYFFDMYEKQNLLYEEVKKIDNVLEIGTYMGHSVFIMLLSNPNLQITTIDIDDTFAKPSIETLNKFFNNKIRFLKGDSLDIISKIDEKFDLIHIDGNHDENIIFEEFKICINLCKNNPIIIFDDIDSMPNVEKYILENFKILRYIKPKCVWNNCLIEIEKI